MLAYQQLSAVEKVRLAVRAAWFEMPQVWVDALRKMPSEVKLTRSAEMWVIARDSIYTRAIARGLSEEQAQHTTAQELLNCNDW
jgi:hypothetical protein